MMGLFPGLDDARPGRPPMPEYAGQHQVHGKDPMLGAGAAEGHPVAIKEEGPGQGLAGCAGDMMGMQGQSHYMQMPMVGQQARDAAMDAVNPANAFFGGGLGGLSQMPGGPCMPSQP